MNLDVNTILDLIKAGPIAMLVLGGVYEWYVWGPTYRREIAEKEAWKAIALRLLNIAEKT